MSDSFVSELQERVEDPSALPHAMRYFVSATAGDRPIGRMRDDLNAGGLDSARVDEAVDLLQRDPALMEAAALAVLQAGWEEPAKRDLVRGALTASRTKLPVVEAAIISIVAVYGMWITATKGRRSHERVVRRGADGTWEEIEKTEWYGPSGPLEAISDVLGLGSGVSRDDATGELPSDPRPPLPPSPDTA